MKTIHTQSELHEHLGLTPEQFFWLRFNEAERFVERSARWTPSGRAHVMSWKVFWNWYLSRWDQTDKQLIMEINVTGVPMFIDEYTIMHRNAFGEQLPPFFWRQFAKSFTKKPVAA